jgi:hypothetical protein
VIWINILLQTLRKEPARRYGSVEGLSEDLGRYLQGRPVRARQDTLWYRARKFVGRNQSALGIAAIVFILLVGGLIIIGREAAIAEHRLMAAEKVIHSLLTDLPQSTLHLPDTETARQLMANEAKRLLHDLQIDANVYPGLRSDLEAAARWDRAGYLDAITGWTPWSATPEYYRTGSDTVASHSGRYSAFIEFRGTEPQPRTGYLTQVIRADDYEGKRVRLSAFSLSEHADHAELFLSAWATCGGPVLAVQTIAGRGAWHEDSVLMDVPENTVFLRYGIGLNGKGLVRLDDVRLEIVDLATPVAPTTDDAPMPAEPVNLSQHWLTMPGSDLKGYDLAFLSSVEALCDRSGCASVSSRETGVHPVELAYLQASEALCSRSRQRTIWVVIYA